MIFTALIGIANVSWPLLIYQGKEPDLLQYAIYKSSVDYQIAAYGEYAASATGGNDFARDFLAGIAVLYSTPSKIYSISL